MVVDGSADGSGVFDSHLHIVDPRFPLVPNQGYLPETFTCADYLSAVEPLEVIGGAVVSGSFQVFDQNYLIAALAELGPGFVGVTQLPVDCPDELILRLHRAGVRAVRFNLQRGGSAGRSDIDTLGRRVFDLAGWHSEFYVRSADLLDLEALLASMPRISIDHLGLTLEGRDALLRLVEGGARVKATGFGRADLDVSQTLRLIHRANPAALMFGTDLPGTRAPRPFEASDVDRIEQALGATEMAKVMRGNALAFYRWTQ